MLLQHKALNTCSAVICGEHNCKKSRDCQTLIVYAQAMNFILPACLAAVTFLVVACDDPAPNPIQKGQSYVDQAREVTGEDHDQKIGLAKGMIEAGRLDDAGRILTQIAAQEQSLPAATREKLDEARRQLETAARAAR